MFDRFLDAENVRKNLSFIIGRTAGKNITVLQNRFEGRRIPKLQRIGWLHIVVPVNQNGPTLRLMLIARPDDGMTGRRNDFRFKSDAFQLLCKPLCALANFVAKFIVGRNTWKS